MKKILARYLNNDLGIVTHILFVIAAASGLFTFNGASLDAVTFAEKARASVFALAGASAIFLFWHYVISILPGLTKAWERALALIITLLWCVLIFFLSSAFNVAGLAGREALELHVSRHVSGIETTLDDQFRESLLIEGVMSDLRIEIERYKEAAKQESDNGIYSGIAGPGAVVNALNGIRGRLSDLLDEAEEFTKKTEALSTSAMTRLETIRKIASSGNPLPRRMRDMAKESDHLRADLAQMDARNFAESITRTLDALPREVDMQTNLSANAENARRQKAALDKVREDVAASAAVLGAFIDKATALPPPQIEAFEKISAVRAVGLYWQNYIPFWAGGVALDIAPLAVVLFLMIGMASRPNEELARIRMLNMTVEEVIRANLSQEAWRRMGLDVDSLTGLMRDITGKERHERNLTHVDRDSKGDQG